MTKLQTNNLVQWQKVDKETNAVFPWFTHPFLEELKTWDLKGKRVLEFGGGRSTRWWRSRAAWVTTIDTNPQWTKDIERDCEGLTNGVLISRQINEGDQSRSQEYVNLGDEYGPYDIVIVDGILRYECLVKALSMQRPLTVIADNWNQAFVWISPPSVELMAPYEIHSFEQEDHTDNDGVNKWKTVYWELKEIQKPPYSKFVTKDSDEHKDLVNELESSGVKYSEIPISSCRIKVNWYNAFV